MTTATIDTEVLPAVMIGRCVTCKRPFRIEIPRSVGPVRCPRTARQRRRHPHRRHPGPVVRLSEGHPVRNPCGRPRSGRDESHGHEHTGIKFAEVKITYKPLETCGGSCWMAKSSKCACSCRGKNHAGGHSFGSGAF